LEEEELVNEVEETLPSILGPDELRAMMKRLMRNLKPFVNPLHSVMASIVFWGAGYMSLEDNERAWKYGGYQLILMVFPIILLMLGPEGFGFNPEEVSPAIFQGIGGLLLVIGFLVLLKNLSQVNDRTVLYNQQGYVTDIDLDRLVVSICVGTSRGVSLKSKFGLFQQRKASDKIGAFIGEVYIDEVRSSTATGRFSPRPGEVPRIGDFAVVKEAVKMQIVDPDKVDKSRYIQVPLEFYERFEIQKAALNKSHDK
jgi:hypothetical protein